MKKSLIAILATLFAFMSGTSSFANSENLGIVPDKLAWFTDSIVEQWTETNDPDSDIIEQAHFARVGGIDNENRSVPVDKRFNRKLIVTLLFINLGSDPYRFDNTSRLELSIQQGNKSFTAEAVPTTSKTIIAPNGRVKKCSFALKMNNRAFTEAFDKRLDIDDLSIVLSSGKLLIEDPKGASVLDSVESPGVISIHTEFKKLSICIFPASNSNFTLEDALTLIDKVNQIIADDRANYLPFFSIQNHQIDAVIGIPNRLEGFIGSNQTLPWIPLFLFNDQPVDNYKTKDVLTKEFKSKDRFKIGIIPEDLLTTYLPIDDQFLLGQFGKCIEKLPESIAPKKYQEVNILSVDNLENPYKILKKYAESGDNEAISAIFKDYDPNDKTGFLSELFSDEESFFEWNKKLADKGYSEAQLNVGLFYDNGVVVNSNLDKAIKYFKSAAEKENVDAMVCYANALLRKEDSKQNQEEATEWYRKAADRNNPRGQFLLSLFLLKNANNKDSVEEGIDWLKQSAHNKYPDAMFRLGLEYYFGILVPKNDAEAFRYIEKAALEGNLPTAVDFLGDCYLRGIGVKPDGKNALICYSIGANHKIPHSMYWYGRFLCDGFNVEKDVAKGYQLIKEAATLGDDEAELYIGLDYYVGAIAKKNENEAFKWVEKSVKDGNLNALVALSDFYGMGVGVKKDFKKAIDLLKQAADKKVPLGMYRLGRLIYENKGANAQQGLNYIKEAAKLGDKDAQDYLDNLDSVNDPADEDDAFGDDSAAEEKNDTTNEAPAADEDEDDLFQ